MKESAEPVIYELNMLKIKNYANGKVCSILKIGFFNEVSALKIPSYKQICGFWGGERLLF